MTGQSITVLIIKKVRLLLTDNKCEKQLYTCKHRFDLAFVVQTNNMVTYSPIMTHYDSAIFRRQFSVILHF